VLALAPLLSPRVEREQEGTEEGTKRSRPPDRGLQKPVPTGPSSMLVIVFLLPSKT
jgi:hypothetical protein